MKKKFLLIVALVLAAAATATLVSCGDEGPAGDMTVKYSLNLGDDLPTVASVVVHYIDAAGKPQFDNITGHTWTKTIKPNKGSGVFGVRVAVSPKDDTSQDSYKLGVESLISFEGSNGSGANAKTIASISQYERGKVESVLNTINHGYHAIAIANNGSSFSSVTTSPFGE